MFCTQDDSQRCDQRVLTVVKYLGNTGLDQPHSRLPQILYPGYRAAQVETYLRTVSVDVRLADPCW
jgi:hypothetical protein